jgi:hypothetical protein
MSQEIQVFTSAALNYIPKVRLLFESLRRFHPDWKLHLLLADELPSDIDISGEPFDEITTISDLDIDSWRGWAFCHAITELATAIKPWMLERLLLKSSENAKVIYLDPDTVAFSPLVDILDALNEASIVLTPHQTSPDSSIAGIMDNEICSLKHGIYNLGFIGVSNTPTGRAFARWWAERTYFFCRDDIPNGLFTDQRWIDLVPAFFPGVAIMRSSRHNVATWNLTTRQLTRTEDGVFHVDGEPLGFYHFTGFDSGAHKIMAVKNGADNKAVQELVSWYSDQIRPLAGDPLTHRPWAFGRFESGELISREQRLVYRCRQDLQLAFPDPFALGGFEDWWRMQAQYEYPGLFDEHTKPEALRVLTMPLATGFLGSQSNGVDPVRAATLLRQVFANPRLGIQMGRRAWEVLRQEGWRGVKVRLH